MPDHDNFGATLRKRRRALALTQRALAAAIGRPQCTISHIELGYIRPRASDRERIERFLGDCEAKLTIPASEPRLRRARP